MKMDSQAENGPSAGYKPRDAAKHLVGDLLQQLRLQNPRAWMAVTNSQGWLMPKSLLTLCKKQAVFIGSEDPEHLLQGLLESTTDKTSAGPDRKQVERIDLDYLKLQYAQLCQELGQTCLTYEDWLNWEGLDTSETSAISREGARSLWLRLVGEDKVATETDFLQLAQVMQQECGLATTIQSFLRGTAGRRKARCHAEEAGHDHQTACLENVTKLAPYNPTPACAIEQALDALSVRSGDILYDLGCGDGRMLLAAARRGARAVGVEYDVRFARKASEAIQRANLGSLAEVICGDALKTNFSKATKIFVYLVPDGLRMMNFALSDASRRGVPIASYLFSLPGWSPHAVLAADSRSAECKVWVYLDSTALPKGGSASDEEKPAHGSEKTVTVANVHGAGNTSRGWFSRKGLELTNACSEFCPQSPNSEVLFKDAALA